MRSVWRHRMLLEAQEHPYSTFYSCSYDDDNIPINDNGQPVLSKVHHQLFMKRLRKKYGKISYYMCGEYGDKTFRPHYHYMLFGIHHGQRPVLDRCWKYGSINTASSFSAKRAAYITGYVAKKMNKPEDERLCGRTPEFNSMSLKPALGLKYVMRLAKNLRLKYPNITPMPIHELHYGKKSLPLGSYLSAKLNEALGVDPKMMLMKKVGYQIQLLEELNPFDYKNFYENVMRKDEVKRNNMIFKNLELRKVRDFNEKIQAFA